MAARIKLVLSESDVNIVNNTSKVTAKLYYYGNGASFNSNNPTGTIVIDGTSYSFNHDFTTSTSAQLMATKSKTVTHNSDGSKTVSVSASFKTGVSLGTLTTSSTLALTKIARASNITLDKTSVLADGTDEVVVTVTKMLATYTDNVTVSLGDYVQTFEGVSGSISFTIPEEWVNAISGTSATAIVKVTTYSGTTVIGSKTANLTVNVPDSVVPIINDISITEAVSVVTNAFDSYFVQNLSQLNVVIDAVGSYGSTIRGYTTTVNGVTYIQQAFTSNVLNTAGTLSVDVEVVDSRGRTAQKTMTIEVVEYAPPTLASMTYAQWDSETGTQSSTGDSTKVVIAGKVSPVKEQNTKTLKLKYKSLASENYTEKIVPLSDWTFSVDVIINDTDPSMTYEYIAELTDRINSNAPATLRVTTGKVTLSRLAGGNGVTLFEEAEEEGFVVGGGKTSHFSGDVHVIGGEQSISWHVNDNSELEMMDKNGSSVLIPTSGNGNLVIGYGGYANANKNTNVYGNDIVFCSASANNAAYRPYLRAGDSFEVILHTAGFITSSKTQIAFVIPLNKPVIGNPTITVTSTDGFMFRQADKYTHGSSASVFVKPSSITCFLSNGEHGGLCVSATFNTTTNAVNNDVIGVNAHIKVTLS